MDKINDLTKKMRAKRESGTHPYVLVLGAGASVSSGTSLNRAVVERVVGKYDLEAFDDYLTECSDDERFAILRDLVEGVSPSKGYQCLVELVRAGYFDVILSTNFDPLLEDSIAELPMRRRDYIFLVHGVMEPNLIADHLDNRIPRVKILKLHGDLFYRKFYYTGDEIKEFPPQISQALEIYLNKRDILIVGHGMRDTDINRCLKEQGGSIWYVGPNPPNEEITHFMKLRKSGNNIISGKNGYYDSFFTQLKDKLLGSTAEANVDEIAQSIFSFHPIGKPPIGSGFLLGDTGLIVTDSTILAALGQGSELGIKAEVSPFEGDHKYIAELVVAPMKVLDYAVFQVPKILESSPLNISDELPNVGEAVTACISVGKTQGFHDGTITDVDCTVPLGTGGGEIIEISNLIQTDIGVTGGACGSPLVRNDGRVVGVIVAGRINGSAPSYALTSVRLREILHNAGLLP